METVLAEGKPLLARAQRAEVEETIREAIGETPTIAESPLNQTIFQGLGMGVGLHHAGILPSVKRLIEHLFERGLCKVVFATETMSLGIHMPARSVVLQSLTKRTDRGFRSLTHNELTQMAGRAGRRGIDPEGKCVIALDVRDGVEDIRRVVDGAPEPVVSQFKLGYGSVALLLGSGNDMAAIRRTVESSFGQYQNLRRIRGLEAEVAGLETAVEDARGFTAPCGDFARIGRYRRVRAEVETARAALGRGGRRAAHTVAEAEPGRFVVARRRGGQAVGLAAARGRPPPQGDRERAAAPRGGGARQGGPHQARVLGDASRAHPARLGAPHPVAEGPARPGQRRRAGGARARGRARRRPRRHRMPPLPVELPAPLRPYVEGAREARDPARPQARDAGCPPQRLLGRVSPGGRGAGALRRRARRQAPRQGTAHRDPAPRQRAARGGDGRIAASWPTPPSPRRPRSRHASSRSRARGTARWPASSCASGAKLKRKLGELETVARTVYDAQRMHQLPVPVSVSTGFMPAVFRWASGEDDWAAIVEESFGGHEGDLIRAHAAADRRAPAARRRRPRWIPRWPGCWGGRRG